MEFNRSRNQDVDENVKKKKKIWTASTEISAVNSVRTSSVMYASAASIGSHVYF